MNDKWIKMNVIACFIDFKMKYLQCIQFDNLVQRFEHFSHQSTFSTKTNIGGLIDSVEFCEIRTTK